MICLKKQNQCINMFLGNIDNRYFTSLLIRHPVLGYQQIKNK